MVLPIVDVHAALAGWMHRVYDAGYKLAVLVFIDNRNERSKVSTKGRIHQRPAERRTRKRNLPEHRLIKPLNWEINLRRLDFVD